MRALQTNEPSCEQPIILRPVEPDSPTVRSLGHGVDWPPRGQARFATLKIFAKNPCVAQSVCFGNKKLFVAGQFYRPATHKNPQKWRV